MGKETLEKLKKLNSGELERGFVTYRTLCDVRFMDPAIEPNDRKPRWTFLGAPGDRQYRPGGHRPLLDAARVAVAVVGGRFQCRRAEVRALDLGAAARDRELGR
jgi:hypothetical protein